MSNAVKGFTLIELMMTLSIAAILMTIAIPSYITFTKNSRITSQANDLITSIHIARGEAARRGVKTALCRSGDATAANPTCGGSNYDYSNGWLVFSIADNRGGTPVYDTTKGDELLALGKPQNGVTVYSGGGANVNLEFNPDGSLNENGSDAEFAVCDERGASHGKSITILATGRPSLSDATDCTP
ncbi:MAG: GspH/FimT family pseudopilin [Gammaproteobacteria bacterium]|jgi:type IV fimbrial biogenesis protein FimT